MACHWPMLRLALIGQCRREWPVAQLITGSTHYRLQYSSVYLEFSCTVDSGVNTLLNFKVFNPINALHVELIILCRTILIHLLIFQTVRTPPKTTRMWWGSWTGSRLTSSSTRRTQMSFPTFTAIWKEEWSKRKPDMTRNIMTENNLSFFRYMYLV